MRCELPTSLLWIRAPKFTYYGVENAEDLGYRQSLTSFFDCAKPFTPRASAVGSSGSVGMFLGTLSFLGHDVGRQGKESGKGHLSCLCNPI
jgi:hypothetical protein